MMIPHHIYTAVWVWTAIAREQIAAGDGGRATDPGDGPAGGAAGGARLASSCVPAWFV